MARKLQERDEFEMVFTFANTGQEDDRTLVFMDRADREWGLGTVWLEASVNPILGRGTGHRVVNFQTASRTGAPFEDVIKKYGIPNTAYPHCTRELKLQPIISYLRSIGWDAGSYLTAVGIRADEQRRVRGDADSVGIIYPLVSMFPTTKPEINDWWDSQPFNLGLEEHQGNCTWCWKKSLRKHIRLARENREIFNFPARMEQLYPLAGSNVDGTPRVFFRGHTSTAKLLQIADSVTVNPPVPDQDEDSGCSESCEAFGYEQYPLFTEVQATA